MGISALPRSLPVALGRHRCVPEPFHTWLGHRSCGNVI
jgi:hypothetical protein